MTQPWFYFKGSIKYFVEKVFASFIIILFFAYIIGSVASIGILWNYQMGDGYILSNKWLEVVELFVFLGSMLVVVVLLMFAYYKLLHGRFFDSWKGINILEEVISPTIFIFFIGFILLGFISAFSDVIAYIATFFYLAYYAYYISGKYKELKIIHDNPDLLELHKRRDEIQDKLYKTIDNSLSSPKMELDKVTDLHTKLTAIQIEIESFL